MAFEESNPMRPQKGSRAIMLPITFDYSGGRGESNKSRIIWSVALLVVGLIISLGIIFNKKGYFFFNLPLGVIVFFVFTFVIRFVLLKESKIRSQQEAVENNDLSCSFEGIWGIYSISDVYPYYCRFRNGKSGVFIRLNKDVILGKYSEAEFEHYEAIGDAYNIAGSSSIQMCHVDYMDNVGTDERLDESFVNLDQVDNPDVKDVLTDILTFQQKQMMERVTTFDVYLFTWTGSDVNAWNIIQQILGCFMEANYVNYHILDSTELRDLVKTLFNVKEFSVIGSMLSTFEVVDNYKAVGIYPISIVKSNGEEEKLGKTRAEREEELRIAEREKELRKEELKRRKKNKGRKNKSYADDEEINLFD